MITKKRQISNLRSQYVSKEILSDLIRKDVPEFSDKFSHFQYATLEMFKGALTLSGRSIFTQKVERKFKLIYLALLKHE